MSRVRVIILSVIAATILVITGVLLLEQDPEPRSPSVQPTGSRTSQLDGRRIYRQRCMYCHLDDGSGIPGQFPPLDGSPWTTGDPERPIRIVLHGMMGPYQVQGDEYNGVMPGWAEQLSFAEIAAVLSYVRSAWDNQAPAVDSAMVRQVWERFKDRKQPWRTEELN